jgi:surface polysaccharide O-acyltransferase-like enzyme
MFIMMSGALILSKPIGPWAAFMRRRSSAVLKPYLFGVMFYLGWAFTMFGSPPASISDYFLSVAQGTPAIHLYFLIVLFLLYIISPLMSGLRDVPKSTTYGSTAILFLLVVADRHLGSLGISVGYFGLGSSLSFLPFFLAGYALHTHGPLPMSHSLALFVVMTGINAALVWGAYSTGSYSADTYMQYTSVNVVLQSIAAFSLMMHFRIRSPVVASIVARLSDLTLGVYIIHLALMLPIAMYVPHVVVLSGFWQVLLYPMVAFMLSLVVVRLLHFIPGVKGFV